MVFAGQVGRRMLETNMRRTLHASALAHVENTSVSAFQPQPSGYEGQYQIVLPYLGLFAYCVGGRRWVIDSNRTLFISPGWEFIDEHPVAGLGHAAVLINPSSELLEEVCGAQGPRKNASFLAASVPSTFRLNLLTHRLIMAGPGASESLARDEWTVHALEEALGQADGGHAAKAQSSSKVIARAKEVLHARSCERLSLKEIAHEVGVSPVYLTQEFSKRENVPLYQYQLRLRLSRALLELPNCDDITGLALDLGFYSHSHFSGVFRRVFGMTPSELRSSSKRPSERLHLALHCQNGSIYGQPS